MTTYDPEAGRRAEEWLETPEAERLDMVREYHRRAGIELPNARLHAALHVVVENQLAMGEADVVNALDRLQLEGLSRHDALHAIASVLSEHLFKAMGEQHELTPNLHQPYFDRLKRLTADEWLRSRGR